MYIEWRYTPQESFINNVSLIWTFYDPLPPLSLFITKIVTPTKTDVTNAYPPSPYHYQKFELAWLHVNQVILGRYVSGTLLKISNVRNDKMKVINYSNLVTELESIPEFGHPNALCDFHDLFLGNLIGDSSNGKGSFVEGVNQTVVKGTSSH